LGSALLAQDSVLQWWAAAMAVVQDMATWWGPVLVAMAQWPGSAAG